MCSYTSDFRLAKQYLARHLPDKALTRFAKAAQDCPACRARELANAFFYMGVTLKKLGYCNSAIRFWISSYRLHKNKFAGRMIKRFANGYGFTREENHELDDKKAFFSIQLSRYLAKKHNGKFSTQAETDMIIDLLEDTWKRIRDHGALNGKSIEEKRRYFKEVKVVFPFLLFTKTLGDAIIKVNFKNGMKVRQNDRCLCGSGLPHCICCGRTPSVEEIKTGIF
jgi:hypothetical protein